MCKYKTRLKEGPRPHLWHSCSCSCVRCISFFMFTMEAASLLASLTFSCNRQQSPQCNPQFQSVWLCWLMVQRVLLAL